MMPKIRVLIVDDHAVVRDGIRALLALADDVEVVGEAANGDEALKRAEELEPDVILMDIGMPLMDGLEATRRIHKEVPRAKVLVLTQFDDREHIFPIIEAGASGFVSKVAASSELLQGIRHVYQGDSYLSPPVARIIVEGYRRGARSHGSHDPYGQLTDRERDVLKLVAEGYTTQEIANQLAISPKTIEGHKTNLMAKLGVRNRIDLVKYAVRKGILTV
ncbi:MAG: response regulator transcription factor [Chloroflexi bacterium]|nr:response regulator transcription factor [Chloroflexota bacterium]